MSPQYKPNTPSVRAMFRSIRVADVQGLKEALSKGADPNALYGKGEEPNHLPLDRALWLHGHEATKGAPLVAALLDSGARMEKTQIPHRRPPMVQALGGVDEGILKVFVQAAGSPQGFVDALPSDQVEGGLSQILWGGSIGSMQEELFRRMWDRLAAEGLRTKKEKGVPWPWSEMHNLSSLPKGLEARIHAHVPRPSPQNTSQAIWCQWMVFLSRMDEPGFLLEEGLSQTPTTWWFQRYERDGGATSRHTLAEELLSFPSPAIVRQGLKKVSELPGGWSDIDDLTLALLIRAGAHSAPLLREVMRTIPEGDHYHALSLALLDVVKEGGSSRSQQAVVRELLKLDADPYYQDSESRTPLHLVASWKDTRPDHILAMANMLVEAGARWDRPQDNFGLTPRDVLAFHNPGLAAQVLERALEEAIPEAPAQSVPKPRPRSSRF